MGLIFPAFLAWLEWELKYENYIVSYKALRCYKWFAIEGIITHLAPGNWDDSRRLLKVWEACKLLQPLSLPPQLHYQWLGLDPTCKKLPSVGLLVMSALYTQLSKIMRFHLDSVGECHNQLMMSAMDLGWRIAACMEFILLFFAPTLIFSFSAVASSLVSIFYCHPNLFPASVTKVISFQNIHPTMTFPTEVI